MNHGVAADARVEGATEAGVGRGRLGRIRRADEYTWAGFQHLVERTPGRVVFGRPRHVCFRRAEGLEDVVQFHVWQKGDEGTAPAAVDARRRCLRRGLARGAYPVAAEAAGREEAVRVVVVVQ